VSQDRIPFNHASVVGQEIDFLKQAIGSGRLAGDGPFTKSCNAQIALMTGANAALLTHSATAALEMAALLCGLEPGDEVIMPSFTFVSTANAVALRGAIPVFVDIDPDKLNIDPAAAASAVTSRTKAIFAVHYAGFPADMDRLGAIALEHGLLLVEDAAQSDDVGGKAARRSALCGLLSPLRPELRGRHLSASAGPRVERLGGRGRSDTGGHGVDPTSVDAQGQAFACRPQTRAQSN
jgi:dTDP-4-amino-4,6-dideoxygalactose transaminase